MSIHTRIDGVTKNLEDIRAMRANVGKYLGKIDTAIDGVDKQLLLTSPTKVIDHIEVDFGQSPTWMNGYATCTYDGSTTTVGSVVSTDKLSDYSGKMTYSVSGASFNLTVYSGWYVSIQYFPFAVLKDGRTRVPLSQLYSFAGGTMAITWTTLGTMSAISTPRAGGLTSYFFGAGSTPSKWNEAATAATSITTNSRHCINAQCYNMNISVQISAISVNINGVNFTPIYKAAWS